MAAVTPVCCYGKLLQKAAACAVSQHLRCSAAGWYYLRQPHVCRNDSRHCDDSCQSHRAWRGFSLVSPCPLPRACRWKDHLHSTSLSVLLEKATRQDLRQRRHFRFTPGVFGTQPSKQTLVEMKCFVITSLLPFSSHWWGLRAGEREITSPES